MKNIIAGPEAAALIPAFLPFAEEGFLLTLTNKGIYNRSRKEYDDLEGTISLDAAGENLEVTLPDEVKVSLDKNIAASRCSCPSRTTCKHVLIALFAAADAASTPSTDSADTSTGAPAAADTELNFAELENITIEDLKKAGSRKDFEEALNAVREGYGAAFSEGGQMLKADIEAYGVTVYFPARNSLQGAVCKCGEKGWCKHKSIAVLSYLMEQKGFDPASAMEDKPDDLFPSPSLLSLLAECRRYGLSLFDKGFISADDTDIDACRQFSLKCEGEGAGNLSRLWRSLGQDLENMLAKNAAFNPGVSFSSLSRIFNVVSLVLEKPDDRERADALIEKSRSQYRTIPMGTFTGLGAHPWITRSGFTGVSVLAYHKERHRIVSFTVSFADFYEGTQRFTGLQNLMGLYTKNSHWDAEVSLKEIAHFSFVLKNFKTNDEGRLSSSKETHFTSGGKTKSADWEEASVDLPQTDEGIEYYDYFSRRDAKYVIVHSGIYNCIYDRVHQVLRFTFHNGTPTGDDDTELPGLIPYSEISEKAIAFLEQLSKAQPGVDTSRWFICMQERRGLIPLSAFGEKGTEDFYFG